MTAEDVKKLVDERGDASDNELEEDVDWASDFHPYVEGQHTTNYSDSPYQSDIEDMDDSIRRYNQYYASLDSYGDLVEAIFGDEIRVSTTPSSLGTTLEVGIAEVAGLGVGSNSSLLSLGSLRFCGGWNLGELIGSSADLDR